MKKKKAYIYRLNYTKIRLTMLCLPVSGFELPGIFLLGAPEFFSLPPVTVPGIFLKVNSAQFPKW